MSFILATPVSRQLLARASVLLVLMISILTVHPASAAIRTCRADPVILLSNGEIIQTDATIETDVANVQQVKYTLHLPVGVRVIAVIHTPSSIREKEVVEFIDDLPPYHYATDTLISTAVPNVRSVAHTRALLRDGSAAGMSGEHLIIKITPLL
jgi:hypothetical protein